MQTICREKKSYWVRHFLDFSKSLSGGSTIIVQNEQAINIRQYNSYQIRTGQNRIYSSNAKQLSSLLHGNECRNEKLLNFIAPLSFHNICNEFNGPKLGWERIGYLWWSSETPFQWICSETRDDNSKHWHGWPIFRNQSTHAASPSSATNLNSLIFSSYLYNRIWL